MGTRLVRLAMVALALAACAAPSILASLEDSNAPAPCVPDAIGFVELPAPWEPPAQPAAADPYEAAQLGIDWLTAALCEWMQTSGVNTDCTTGRPQTCMGCHVQAAPVLGLARSTTRCYAVPATPCVEIDDESPVEFGAQFIAQAQRKDCILGTPVPGCAAATDPTTLDGYPPWLGSIGHYPRCGSNAGPASVHPIIQSAHGAMALVGYTDFISSRYAPELVALADYFPTAQQADGSLTPDRFEAPIDQGACFVTASALFTWVAAAPFGDAAQVTAWDAAVSRAVAWLRGAPIATTQDKTFSLLGLLSAGLATDDTDVARLRDDLLDDVLADGGWAERPGLGSNAYATGQAVNALIEAAVPLDHPALCSGVGWLVDRQNVDGSWDLGTPGVTTDASRSSRFTATIWPVLALGALHPFGGRIEVPFDVRETCDDHVVMEVTIRHAADTACGLFARPDTFELTVTSLDGDSVWVEPDLVPLASGGSATVRVHWDRVATPRTPGSMSITQLSADSIGGRDAGCPIEAQSTLVIVVPPDTPPPAIAPRLTVERAGPAGRDLLLRWPRLPEPPGTHEVVAVRWLARDRRAVSPTQAALDASAPLATTAANETARLLGGEGALLGSGLTFYKVRARTACDGLRGPTCNFACSDARRCDGSCP